MTPEPPDIPEPERPHFIAPEAEQFAGMDEMSLYATQHPEEIKT